MQKLELEKSTRWYGSRIANKILFSVLTVFGLLYIPTFIFIFNQNKTALIDSAEIESLSIARILSLELFRNYELETDSREIQSVLVGARQSNSDILELKVINSNKKILNSTFENSIGSEVAGEEFEQALRNKHTIQIVQKGNEPHIRLIHPVSAGPGDSRVATGIVEMRLSLQRQLSQLADNKRNLVLASALLVLTIIIVITRISASITGPLRELYHGMERANQGDLDVRIPVRSKDEVGYATETFNTMLSSIQLSDKELRENTKQLLEMNDNLSRLSNRLREAERLEVIGTLTSVIAHQLKNPMSIIQGAVSSIRRRSADLSSDALRFVDILEHESERTRGILERFLVFAKKQEVVRQPLALQDFLQDVVHTFQPALGDVELSLICHSNPSVAIDKTLMTEVLMNILNNALESVQESESPEQKITVEVNDGPTETRIAISDTGDGFSAAAAEQACAPFFSTRPKGTGLGLSMARKIVTLHGGELSFENITTTGGARIIIFLPKQGRL